MNRLIVFFCTGLWHGANWTFVLWGLFHGLFLILETIFPKFVGKMGRLRHIYVLLVVCVGFVLFRADSVEQAWMMLTAMFTGTQWTARTASAAAAVCDRLFLATLPVAAVGALPVKEWVEKRAEGKKYRAALNVFSYAASAALLLICMMSLAGGTYNPFIYFRF